jgi:hypothetical protein
MIGRKPMIKIGLWVGYGWGLSRRRRGGVITGKRRRRGGQRAGKGVERGKVIPGTSKGGMGHGKHRQRGSTADGRRRLQAARAAHGRRRRRGL